MLLLKHSFNLSCDFSTEVGFFYYLWVKIKFKIRNYFAVLGYQSHVEIPWKNSVEKFRNTMTKEKPICAQKSTRKIFKLYVCFIIAFFRKFTIVENRFSNVQKS